MRRRTVRGRGGPWVVVRAALAWAVVVAVAFPGATAVAAEPPSPYGFPPAARTVTGSTGTTDAESLEPGEIYRSSLPAEGKQYYRLDLDDTPSDAYVAVTAVPRADTTVSSTDGIRVSLEDADGAFCDSETATVGLSKSPRPFVASVVRAASSQRAGCKGAGAYYVIVERVTGTDSSSVDWGLELTPVIEPGVEEPGVASAPESWDSSTPDPLVGKAVPRAGGAGFARAKSLEQGVWSTDITPGETLFYAVPVDWGQRLRLTVELGSDTNDGGIVIGALTVSLYNPARGPVVDLAMSYSGRQRSDSLASVPPVEYDNRYAPTERVNNMRFAGSYYLVLHLSQHVADEYGDEALGVTLRVRVDGTGEAAPDYTGESVPRGLFEVDGRDGDAVAAGGAGAGDDDTALTILAAAGLGSGTVLLAGLAAWTVVARRRARA